MSSTCSSASDSPRTRETADAGRCGCCSFFARPVTCTASSSVTLAVALAVLLSLTVVFSLALAFAPAVALALALLVLALSLDAAACAAWAPSRRPAAHRAAMRGGREREGT